MGYRVIPEERLTAIGNAIREKDGSTALITDVEMPNKIKAIKSEDIIKHSDIPNYVKDAVFDIANKVEQVRQKDSIVFMAMSDSHHLGEQFFADNTTVKNINTSNQHACMAAKILSYLLKVDFNCHLGDITFGHSTTTEAYLKQQIEEFNSYLDEAYGGVPQFRCVGNHDTGYYSTRVDVDYLYSVIGKYCESDDTVYDNDNKIYGYCYRDFDDKKLRVICLNSSESDMKGSTISTAMSNAQLIWFAKALQGVGSKEGWSVMVLSHFPLDFNYRTMHKAADIVKAYIGTNDVGESITIDGTTINFNGSNKAKFIANVHGHVHCFKFDKLHTITNDVGTKFDAWRVCVPTSNSSDSVQLKDDYTKYGIQWYEDEVYYKKIGTYEDTAFVINVVNPSEQKIYSFCYGAGYDRVIGYAKTVYYSISNSLTNVTTSDSSLSWEEKQPYTATLTANEGYELSNVTVKMGGVDITSSVYSNGVISIPSVTGNIVITAVAVKVTAYVNQILTSTEKDGITPFNGGKGFLPGSRLSSGETTSNNSGYATTGYIACDAGDLFRLKNITFDLTKENCRIALYDSGFVLKNEYKGTQVSAGFSANNLTVNGNNLEAFKIPTTSGASTWKYFRMSAMVLDEDSIITRNQVIE